MGAIVGIDLGTTNSLVGLWRSGAPVLIPNALGQRMTPSAVSVTEAGEVVVGLAARDHLVTDPGRTAAAFKRLMGTDRVLDLGGRGFRPEDLSALVLGALKEDAEQFLGEPVTEAVITVPAYFNDLQRKATKLAGEIAGLRAVRLLTEPTAAALAYAAGGGDEEALILVVDLGGGTFDVSILHRFDGVMEVRAAAGDSRLGGEDFVDAMVAAFRDGAGVAEPGPKLEAAIRREAELAKRRLSEADVAEFSVQVGGREARWSLTREDFEALSEPLLARIRRPIEQALRDARVRPEDLTQVILVGGASRMPMVRRLIGRLFRRLPLQHVNPDEAVALGAAVRAGMAMRAAELEEAIMIDVTPFSLGVQVVQQDSSGRRLDGLFCPIIERNTVVPASRATRVSTVYDRQREIRLTVFQGESRFVKDNLNLGEMVVAVPPRPAGEQVVEVRLTVDAGGLLELEAQALETGVLESLVIHGPGGAAPPEEVAARLKALQALKRHPRDEAENIALTARANRLYENMLGGARLEVGEALAEFAGALESQEPDRIRQAAAALNRVMDRYDGDVFL